MAKGYLIAHIKVHDKEKFAASATELLFSNCSYILKGKETVHWLYDTTWKTTIHISAENCSVCSTMIFDKNERQRNTLGFPLLTIALPLVCNCG